MARRGAGGGGTRLLTCLRRGALGASLLLATARPCLAEPTSADYLIDFWNADSGLPGNSATALAQTREGYLWLGTYDGLIRFDGIRFVKFDPSNTPALRHARVDRLFVDANGALWINTHDGSLVCWRQGVFTREWEGESKIDTRISMVSSSNGEEIFYAQTGTLLRREVRDGRTGPWQTIRAPGAAFAATYCVAGSGEPWISSNDGRLWRVVAGRPEPVPTPTGLAGQRIKFLTTDAEGRVWVGTEREIAVWSGTAFSRMTPVNGEPKIDVTFLHFTRDGGYWAVANGRLRKALGRRWVCEPTSARHLATAVPPTLMAEEDRDGGVWFAHDGRGLLHLRRDGTSRRFTPADGFATERVKCLLEDREGNVWVSVDRGGLARLRERRFRPLVLGRGQTTSAAVSVQADRRGSVWFGTLGRGLGRFRAGVSDRIPLPPPASGQFVFSVFPDAHDRLWMSADFEDLWLLERGRVRRAPWPVHGIKSILVDRAGRVWLGKKDGLSCLERGSVRTFGLADGLPAIDVRALAEDTQGAIWVGCGDGTIYRYRNGAFQPFRVADSDATSPVWSLLADQDGAVWAGTHGGGLLRLKDGRFTRYTTQNGLLSDVVCQLIDDQEGRLWLGSRAGILRIPKTSLEAVARGSQSALPSLSYGHADGLPPVECSGYQPSSSRDAEGRLWFATTKGVFSVMPAQLRENPVPPSVLIEEVRVDGEPQSPSAAPRQPAGPRDAESLLIIPPGKRYVELRYAGLSLTAPDKVRFRYRLEGLERDWVDAGLRHTAQYSYLYPRDYRFRVIACNSDGVWNEQGARLTLRVLPHFWEIWWIRGLAALIALGLTALSARQLASRRLRRDMARLERQRAIEHDRTRIAKDIHDDLGAGLTQITLLSELVRSDRPQEAETHLEQISDRACELTRAMDEIVWAVDPANDTLESLWGYLSHFTQEYLSLAGIQCRLDAPDQLPVLPLTSEVRHNVFLAVKEALTNAVKHSAAKELALRIEAHAGSFSLIIEDDGRGFDPESVTPNPRGPRVASGHGLPNMAARMLSIGGRCTVRSEIGRGTRVELDSERR